MSRGLKFSIMYNLIPPIIIILSLGGILVIFLKKINLMSKDINTAIENSNKNEDSQINSSNHQSDNTSTADQSLKVAKIKLLLNKSIERLRFKEIKYSMFQFLEKNLRKIKIYLMRIENIASSLTKKLSEKIRKFNQAQEETEKNNSTQKMIQENQEEKKDNQIKETTAFQTNIEPQDIGRPELEREFIEQEKEFIYRIAKNPNDIESYVALGDLYLGIKNYDDAKQSFEHALKINLDNKRAKAGIKKIEKAGNDAML